MPVNGLNQRHEVLVPDARKVESLSWSPTGHCLAAVCLGTTPLSRYAGQAFLIDPLTWQFTDLPNISPMPSSAAVAWSPDGQRLALLEPKALVLWDCATAQVLHRVTAPDTEFFFVSWNALGNRLIVGATIEGRSDLTLWTVEPEPTRSSSLELPRGSQGVAWAKSSPKGQSIASVVAFVKSAAVMGFRLAIWPNQGMGSPYFTNLPGEVEQQDQDHGWSPTGEQIAVAVGLMSGAEGSSALTIWDAASLECKQQFFRQEPSLIGAAWSPDGELLATSTGKKVLLFDPNSGQLVQELDSFYPQQSAQKTTTDSVTGTTVSVTTSGFVRTFTWSPDGRWLVAGTVGGLRLWERA